MMRKGRSLTVFAAWILALVMAVCVLPASAENVSAEPPASTAEVETDTAEYEQNAGSTADSDSYAGVPSDDTDDRYAYPDTNEIPDGSSDYPEFCDGDDDPSVSLYASGVTVGPTRFTLIPELDEIRLQIEYAENANRFRIYRRAAGETKFVRIDTIACKAAGAVYHDTNVELGITYEYKIVPLLTNADGKTKGPETDVQSASLKLEENSKTFTKSKYKVRFKSPVYVRRQLPKKAGTKGTLKLTGQIDRIHLSWENRLLAGADIDGYVILRRKAKKTTYVQVGTAGANRTAFNDTGVRANAIYYYYVLGYKEDAAGVLTVSPYSYQVGGVTKNSNTRNAYKPAIRPAAISIYAGETKALKLDYPKDVCSKSTRWRTADKSVAKVTQKGVVTGVFPGTTTVYARTLCGREIACSVLVEKSPADGWHYEKAYESLLTMDSGSIGGVASTRKNYYYWLNGRKLKNRWVDGRYLDANGLSCANKKGTLKGFLTNGIKPVGQTAYVFGGGYPSTECRYDIYKGVPKSWKKFYDKQKKSYDFEDHYYEFKNGLDCSGFVGWTVYNTVNTKSGNQSFTMQSGSEAVSLANRGFGTLTAASRIKSYQPGDIMYINGHIWICMGQCRDGSVVILHSSPNGVQINGTQTPAGKGDSTASRLAKKYMAKYYPGWKWPVVTHYYYGQYNQFRWTYGSKKLMRDPDGWRSKTAGQILKLLFDN